MEYNELINSLMPYIISAAATVLAAVGAWLGTKVKAWLDTKEKKDIVEATVKYVEQIGKALGSDEKLELAKQKALDWAKSKGISVSDIELEILIEATVNGFSKEYNSSDLLVEEVADEPVVSE